MILDQIIKQTKEDLALRKSQTPFEKLQELAAKNPRDIKDAVKALKSSTDEPYRIIAEVKKASPSKGLIRPNFAPVEIAKEYPREYKVVPGLKATAYLTSTGLEDVKAQKSYHTFAEMLETNDIWEVK